MNGLLKKDLLLVKASGKTYLFLILFYTAFSLFSSSSLLFTVITLIVVMLPLSSFSLDELARWDQFAAALPGGRRAVVRSKYQLLFLTCAGALIFSVLVSLLIHFFGREGAALPELMASALGCTAAGLLVSLLLYPFLFKYGTQKARLFLALAVGVIFAALAIGVLLFQTAGFRLAPRISPAVAAAAAAAVLAAAVISYRVSRRVYDRREF